jgi:hypothetical protein
MGSDNILRDTEGNKPSNSINNNDGSYRYDRDDSVTTPATSDIQKQIDEQNRLEEQRKEQRKREDEESERKRKELIEKAKQTKPIVFEKKKTGNGEEGIVAGPSPVSSMMQWF